MSLVVGPPPPPGGKRSGRRRVVIGALVAIVVLIASGAVAGGVVAGVTLTRHHDRAGTAPPNTGAPNTAPNTGPFTGTYRAHFGAGTNLDDVSAPGTTPTTGMYGVRSACRPTGCVATMSRLSGDSTFASTMVFDSVGGSWVAVALSSNPCRNAPTEIWEVITLQPRPDGTFTGEQTTTASNLCGGKHTVTFTRTGDVDVNKLPDPLSLPPRVVSPAEALHGRYHQNRTFTMGNPQQSDFSVSTNCLRTGDRCMSYFHAPTGFVEPLVFDGGNWVFTSELDDKCPGNGAPVHVKKTGQYPLPQPPQDPITLLTGHGHQEQTGSCAASVDFDETFTRTGD